MPADTPVWLRSALERLASAQERSEERFAVVEAQLGRLAVAQERTDQRFDQLAAALQDLAEQVARLTAAQAQMDQRLVDMDQRFDRMEERFDGIDRRFEGIDQRLDQMQAGTDRRFDGIDERFDRIDVRLGRVSGRTLEDHVRSHAFSYFGQVARGIRVLDPPQRDNLLDPAVRQGKLSEAEAVEIRRADVIIAGRDRDTDTPVVFVVEVSGRVATRDVDRALSRARLAAKLGGQAIAVVAGERIDRDAEQSAQQAGVRRIVTED